MSANYFMTKERFTTTSGNYFTTKEDLHNEKGDSQQIARSTSPIVLPLEKSVERKKQKQMAVTV